MGSRNAALGLGALLLVTGLALRGDARPDDPLPELWNLTGSHNTRGAFTGTLSLKVGTDGGVAVTEKLTFSDQTTLSWVGTGELKGRDVHFKGPQSVGLVGAIEGDKNAKTKGLHGIYKISKDGKTVEGNWRDDRDKTRARSKGTSVSAGGMQLVLVDGDGKDVPKDKKGTDGVIVAPDCRERPETARQLLPFRLEKTQPSTGTKWAVDFHEGKVAVFKDSAGTDAVKSGEAFDGADKLTLYVGGVVPGDLGASESLGGRLVKDGQTIAHDSGKVTVAQAAFMVCGHGHSSTYKLTGWASEHKLDARQNPTLIMGKNEKGKPQPWALFITETRQGATMALSTPGAVVSYDGHSNFGLGFAFAEGYKKLREFMLISDPQCAVGWTYLREHQGHPDLMFEESEYGDDSSTTEFSDPVAVQRAIKGAHGSYDNMRTVRFPLSGGQGNRLPLRRGTNRWDDNHGAIDGSRIVLKSGAPDMPKKGWSKLMLNSCYSGPYYYESFGGRGTLFFTLEESSSWATTANFIAGCIEGKSNDDILKSVNAEENIWDYYVFGQ